MISLYLLLCTLSNLFFLSFKNIYVLIYLWLHLVFTAEHGLFSSLWWMRATLCGSAQLLIAVASLLPLVAEPWVLGVHNSVVVVCGFTEFGSVVAHRLVVLLGIYRISQTRDWTPSSTCPGGFSTTRTPGSPFLNSWKHITALEGILIQFWVFTVSWILNGTEDEMVRWHIISLMDMNLSKFQEVRGGQEAWKRCYSPEVASGGWATRQKSLKNYIVLETFFQWSHSWFCFWHLVLGVECKNLCWSCLRESWSRFNVWRIPR